MSIAPNTSSSRRVDDAQSSTAGLSEEKELGKVLDRQLIARLWKYVAPYGWQVALTLVLVVPLFFFEAAPAWIIKEGIDHVLTPVSGDAPPSAFRFLLEPQAGLTPLGWLAALYLVTIAIDAALRFLHMVIMSVTGQNAMRDLRRDIFDHLQSMHLGYFDQHPIGRLVTRASNDVENIAEMFSSGIISLVTDILKMIGFATVLFLVSPRLAAITFSVMPVLVIAALVFRLRIRAAFRKVRVLVARLNATLQETLTGMKVVQLFTREERNLRDFDEINALHRDAWYQSIRYDSALFALVELAGGVSVAIIIAAGSDKVEAGELFLFIELMRRFFMPLRDLSAKFSVMQSAMASSERIFELLDTEPGIADPEKPVVAQDGDSQKRGVVEFDRVSFAYQGEDWVLKDISFRVEAGEKVAFVGATGAGKSSIIKLLTRLYDVNEGGVRLDGVDLRDLAQRDLRQRVSMVLQDVFLFRGTVGENISLERPGVDEEQVRQAAKLVDAHGFIQRLPQGYDTPVQERGSNLSSGQQQLISFARTLAQDFDVLLLDEATSSIDTETEAMVQSGIHRLMEGKTAIVIAHRLSTIEDVDRIYVMDRGEIVESGSHVDLLALRGVYHRLYTLQYAGT
jgi:ATP-binding cassette subfamily B multidrug efflux pump